MSARNPLLSSPPYAVEQAIRTLGRNLRTARLRRNLTLAALAEKIGVHRGVVADAENGKPSTGIAIYVALLWALGLSEQVTALASPSTDDEGAALARARERSRAGSTRGDDDDF